MAPHQEYQSAEYLVPRYEVKNDEDGDMLFLENSYTGEAFVLCGTPDEIHSVLEDAISHIAYDKENRMKPVQSLIQKAHDKGLLRYAPPNLVWDDRPARQERQFELSRTGMTGVEFGYNLSTDKINWAIQSIDGVELEVDGFLNELQRAVGIEEQPCQQYTRARVITDEEPYVTRHNDEEQALEEPERTYLVTQVTSVKATDRIEAIERVNTMHGSCELVSQDADAQLKLYRVGAVHEFWAEDSKHAVEQFYDTIGFEREVDRSEWGHLPRSQSIVDLIDINLIEEVEA